jgi:sugar lactone lactonase YvrE
MNGLVSDSFRKLAPVAHAEAVATDHKGVLWITTENGRLCRLTSEGDLETVSEISAYLLGLCSDASGRLYCCGYDTGAIHRFDPGTLKWDVYSAAPLRNPNWALFARDGSMLVSDSGSEDMRESATGRIVCIPAGGGAGTVLSIRAIHYANGLALTPGGALYIAESFTSRILRYTDGRVEEYAHLQDAIPDGLALDEEGGLLVGCFQPNRVLRIPPGGGHEPQLLLDDWTGQDLLTPTNLSFYGDDLSDIAIASLCGWTLSAASVPWRGLALNYPALS